MPNKTEVVTVLVLKATDKAVLVRFSEDDSPTWLPLSQITDPDERYIRETAGEEIEIEIPHWLADEKGMI